MAKCELTIELDSGRTAFHPGDEVTGSVLVTTSDEMKCDALTIELNWETHGRGNRAKGETQKIELFSGEFRTGTSMRYGFKFTMPSGPATYNGHYLNVGWFLRARADVPWKLDPKAEQEISLSAGPEDHQKIDWRRQFRTPPKIDLKDAIRQAREGTPGFSDGQDSALGGRLERSGKVSLKAPETLGGKVAGCGCLLLILSPFIGLAVFFGSAGVRGLGPLFEGDFEQGFPGLIFLAVVLFVGGGLTIAFVRWRLLKSRFGEIDFQISPEQVYPGESASVRVAFTPTKDTTINGVIAKLTATEIVVSGSGTNKTTRRHQVVDEEIQLLATTHAMANRPVRIEGQVPIPANAPPSFQAPSNRLRWEITTHMDVARFPDWKQAEEIVVKP